MLHLQPFKVHQIKDDHALVFSSRGVAEITNPALTEYLKAISGSENRWFHQDDIKSDLISREIKPEAALDFLSKDLLLFREIPEQVWEVHNVAVLSPDRVPTAEFLDELSAVTGAPARSATSEEILPSKSLIILHLEQYNPDYIRELFRRTVGLEQCSLLVSYVLDRTFFIDGAYFPGAYVPCHFCHIDRLRMIARHGYVDRQNNWFSFYNYLEDRQVSEVASFDLSPIDRAYTHFLLRTRLRDMVGRESLVPFTTDVLSYTQADLDTGEIERDMVPLWDCCTCLTQSW